MESVMVPAKVQAAGMVRVYAMVRAQKAGGEDSNTKENGLLNNSIL